MTQTQRIHDYTNVRHNPELLECLIVISSNAIDLVAHKIIKKIIILWGQNAWISFVAQFCVKLQKKMPCRTPRHTFVQILKYFLHKRAKYFEFKWMKNTTIYICQIKSKQLIRDPYWTVLCIIIIQIKCINIRTGCIMIRNIVTTVTSHNADYIGWQWVHVSSLTSLTVRVSYILISTHSVKHGVVISYLSHVCLIL